MSQLDKHNHEHARIGDEMERAQGDTLMAALRFAQLVAKILCNNNDKVKGKVSADLGKKQSNSSVELGKEQNKLSVELGEEQTLIEDRPEVASDQDLFPEYASALQNTQDSVRDRFSQGYEEYNNSADRDRKNELYTESQVLSDVSISLNDKRQQIENKQQKVQLLQYQNEALGQNLTATNQAIILENNQQIAGLKTEIKSDTQGIINDTSAINKQLATEALGSLKPENIAITLPSRSAQNESLESITTSMYGTSFAMSLPTLSSASVDGITVQDPEMTDFGAERTTILDEREPDNPKTFFVDNYRDLGVLQLSSPQSGELLRMKDGKVNFMNLDGDSKSLINALEKSQTDSDIALFQESQSLQSEASKASTKKELDQPALVGAKKSRDIEL